MPHLKCKFRLVLHSPTTTAIEDDFDPSASNETTVAQDAGQVVAILHNAGVLSVTNRLFVRDALGSWDEYWHDGFGHFIAIYPIGVASLEEAEEIPYKLC